MSDTIPDVREDPPENRRDGDPDDLTAAELAFGLLDPQDRAAAQERLARDPAFAALHAWWQDRALSWFDGAATPAPGQAWDAIRRRLPANDSGPAAAPVWRWQAATALAASLALVFGTMLLLRPTPAPAPRPTIVVAAAPAPRPLLALLAGADRADAIAVSYDPAHRAFSAIASPLAIGAHDAELWVIPAGGKPVSLGIVTGGGATRRGAQARTVTMLVPGSTLAISVEPRGGSPTGQPTGAVILSGALTRS